jgi:hypothetical protein
MEFVIVGLVLVVLYRMRGSIRAYIQPHIAELGWFTVLALLAWAYCKFQLVRDLVSYLLSLLPG